jgi:hypothetical protein
LILNEGIDQIHKFSKFRPILKTEFNVYLHVLPGQVAEKRRDDRLCLDWMSDAEKENTFG